MTKKKGKLLTFCWSLIPGAGEMYLGFFKQGISLMAAFAVLLAVSYTHLTLPTTSLV